MLCVEGPKPPLNHFNLWGPSLSFPFLYLFFSSFHQTKSSKNHRQTPEREREIGGGRKLYHEMVGLSVVLEEVSSSNKDITKKAPQVISKASMNMIKPPSPAASCSPTTPSPSSTTFSNPFSRKISSSCNPSCFLAAGFLDHCFLCKQKLLPGRDIYMYKGDRAFCSEECRLQQIFMDEEESTTLKAKTDHYCSSFAAIKPQKPSTSSSSSSRCRKGARNQANGFAC